MTEIQLFAYEIDTHNPSKINNILRGKGADPEEMTEEQYFHLQANLQRDLVIANVVPNVKSGLLSVFLAPEFFFKWRDGLPYSRETFFNGIGYLENLSEAFREVLWVLGTVWWQEPVNGQEDLTRVHNSALIFQNGKLLHSWQKERLSQIDGLRDGPQVWDRSDAASARILEQTQDPFFDAVVPGSGASLSCGIEICLDHLTLAGPPISHGVLRQKFLAANSDPTTGTGVDLHLLTAAGMKLQSENIAARRGGAFFRCDGGKGAAPRSQNVMIDRPGGTPAEALHNWTPVLDAMTPFAHIGVDPDDRVAVYKPVKLS